MVILNRCFKQDPEWGRETVQFLKKTLGLKTAQIYKWGYDRKKLAEKENSEEVLLSFSKRSKSDSFMTDLSIDDYNYAVLKIWESISKHPSKEGLVRKEGTTETSQNSLKLAEFNKENSLSDKYWLNSNTNSVTLSESSEIVPSKLIQVDNRIENEDMIWLTSEKLEAKEDVEEIVIDDSNYIEESLNDFQYDDTYNYMRLHWEEYNQILNQDNYNLAKVENLGDSIIDWELSSEAEYAMNQMQDL